MNVHLRPSATAAEDVAEQLLGVAPVQKMLGVGGALVGVAGRDGDALDAHRLHLVEEVGDPLGVGAVEQRAVDVDAKSLGLGRLDRLDGDVVDARLADRLVVHPRGRRRDGLDQVKLGLGLNRSSFFSSSRALVHR